MGKTNWHKVLLAITVLIIIGLAVFCCVSAHDWDSNLVSMISGLWSAVATFAVGIIAFYQSKRYKKLADQTEERHDAPEFYIPTPVNSLGKVGQGLFHNIVCYGTYNQGGLSTSRDFLFSSIDKPILNLSAKYVLVDGKKQVLSIKQPYGIDIYEKRSGFYVDLKDCVPLSDGKHKLEMCLHFKNIYGTTYQKIYTSEISIQANRISNHSWGTLSKAERIE